MTGCHIVTRRVFVITCSRVNSVENIGDDKMPARQGRSSKSSKFAHTDDTEESEPETPRPQKTHLKKRLSEVQIADNDGSFSLDDGGVKFNSVDINDDAAEKRKRRKSTKIAAPSIEGAFDQEMTGESSKAGRQRQLNSLAAPEINVPLDIMSSNFEEWMKMATDNVRSESHP